MTKREFLNAIVAGNVTEEMQEMAQVMLSKLDNANSARRTKNAEKMVEKNKERAPLRDKLFALLTVEPKTASTLIAEAELDLKPQSIPSLMKPFLEEGTVVKDKVKVTGKGAQVGYRLAAENEEVAAG